MSLPGNVTPTRVNHGVDVRLPSKCGLMNPEVNQVNYHLHGRRQITVKLWNSLSSRVVRSRPMSVDMLLSMGAKACHEGVVVLDKKRSM